MELVHSDVAGKLETSYNDFNYYVIFLDDFSKKKKKKKKIGFILSNINLMFPIFLLNFIDLFLILLHLILFLLNMIMVQNILINLLQIT